MKLVSSVVALLLLSSAASYADTPDILSSVSKDAVQIMAKDDAAKTRGQYYECVIVAGKPTMCNYSSYWSAQKLTEYNSKGKITRQRIPSLSIPNYFYVSR